jgi:agmatine deiminase
VAVVEQAAYHAGMSSLENRTDTPGTLGYRWPAEWEPQAAVWLSWPRNRNTWPGRFEPVPAEFAAFALVIAEFEPVHILAGGDELEVARRLMCGAANVTLHDVVTNDSWCRDHGPSFLTSRAYEAPSYDRGPLAPALVDWQYNAWGGKYPPFDLDNQVPERVAEITGRRRFLADVVLEGGAIEGNGRGTILTTESCLLNPNRNGTLGRAEIEQYLRAFLNARHVAWLRGGEVAGDDTDGHIDQLARFVGPRTVVCAVCEDPADENYAPTQQNLVELQNLADQDGQHFEVIGLPLPEAMFVDDQRLPASYCNFLIVNGAVLVPKFGDAPADDRACGILRDLLPGRVVRSVASRDLVWGLGSLHCLSQQEAVP